MDRLIEEALSKNGFIVRSVDGEIMLEPSVLKLQSINMKAVRRGRYISDPALVPAELQDKNILWIDEPPKVTGVTESGEEIQIVLENVTIGYETIEPEQ